MRQRFETPRITAGETTFGETYRALARDGQRLSLGSRPRRGLVVSLVGLLACAAPSLGCGGAGPGSPAPTSSIVITGVDAPTPAEGDVGLTVHLSHADLASAAVAVDVSPNSGAFKAAHINASPVSASGASGGDGTVAVVWHSLQDVSPHGKQSIKLLFTPRDSKGEGTPFTLSLSISNLRSVGRRINFPLVSYGAWDSAAIMSAKQHDLLVIHPNADGVSRDLVKDLQSGMNPSDPADDIIVLCYISVGEDDRASVLTDDEARADPRFRGDGTGPRIDPRGPTPEGGALAGISVQGKASSGGTGWASYYLDDNSLAVDGVGDGIPDRNSSFGGYFVNAGDPKWFEVVDKMTLDGPDGSAGFKELLTTTTGRGLGCDGVFLDTIDTVAPNGWTSPGDSDLTQFEWTAPGMAAFITRVRNAYPDSLLLQNRGDFFLNPALEMFAYTTRGAIDYFLFESYRLTSSSTDGIDPLFYPDNQYDIMPKVVAESQRPDGFRTLSIGYVEGTESPGAADTLVGKGTVALASLLEDIRVTERVAGFRHYLTNADLTLTNTFVKDHTDLTDTEPPTWSSVWNENEDAKGLPAPPTARVGLQSVTAGQKQVTVRWDVALDFNRVSYALYYAKSTFDFAADPTLSGATRVVLTPRLPVAYGASFAQSTLPFEDTISLDGGATYHFVLRAFDSTGNEDRNTVSLTASVP